MYSLHYNRSVPAGSRWAGVTVLTQPTLSDADSVISHTLVAVATEDSDETGASLFIYHIANCTPYFSIGR